MDEALYRVPALETVEIRQIVNGPESFTPDTLALLGEAPEVNTTLVYIYPQEMCCTICLTLDV